MRNVCNGVVAGRLGADRGKEENTLRTRMIKGREALCLARTLMVVRRRSA